MASQYVAHFAQKPSISPVESARTSRLISQKSRCRYPPIKDGYTVRHFNPHFFADAPNKQFFEVPKLAREFKKLSEAEILVEGPYQHKCTQQILQAN